MLYQLLKRDPLARQMPFWGLLFLVVFAILARFAPAADWPDIIALAPFGCGFCWGLMFLGERASRFQASLPIEGRDLMSARIIGTLTVFWAPVLAAAVCLLYFRPAAQESAWGMLAKGAMAWPVCVLAVYSVRIRENSVPRWLSTAMFLAAFLGFNAGFGAKVSAFSMRFGGLIVLLIACGRRGASRKSGYPVSEAGL